MLLKVAIPGYQSNNEESVEFFLIAMVLIFTSLSLLFLLLLFISKLSEMRKVKRKSSFQPLVEQILLGIVFENKSVEIVRNDPEYRKLFRKKFFRSLMIKNAISLHTSFAGDYQKKLEQFYTESGLVNVSTRKLKNRKWHIRCEGINELSRMQVYEALPAIQKLVYARNNTLKLEAMLGIIRLQGTEGLLSLAEHTDPINDWIQLNIMTVVKHAGYHEIPDFGKFLASANESVVVLGIRLATTFGQAHHLPLIREIISTSASRRILLESKHLSDTFDPSPLQSGSL